MMLTLDTSYNVNIMILIQSVLLGVGTYCGGRPPTQLVTSSSTDQCHVVL